MDRFLFQIRVDARRGGLMLVLVSGILTMLALMAALLVQISGTQQAYSRAVSCGVQAVMVGESGIAYAAARLWEQPLSIERSGGTPGPVNRGDDWAPRGNPFRDSGETSPLLNPSYSHGTAWQEVPMVGNDPGAYDKGMDTVLSQDGSFSACTGRLRGERFSGPARFSLHVTAQGADKICLNSGELGSFTGDHDLDGTLNRDDPEYGIDLNDPEFDGVPAANGVPDWRDPGFEGNVHIVNLLDNLGLVVGLPKKKVPWGPVDKGYPYPCRLDTTYPLAATRNEVGRRIIAARPRGGYQDIEELKTVLTGEEYTAMAPFLSVVGDIVPVGFPAFHYAEDGVTPLCNTDEWTNARQERFFEFHARIGLNTAPPEVLKAMFLNVCVCGRSIEFIRLKQDEVGEIVDAFVAVRPMHAWGVFLEFLERHAGLFTPDDFWADYLPDVRSQVLKKEDLILSQLMMDSFYDDPNFSHRRKWGCTRLDGSGCAYTRDVLKGQIGHEISTTPRKQDGKLSLFGGDPELLYPRMTTEGTFISPPPAEFLVTCENATDRGDARVRRVRARIAGPACFALRLGGQQDFEQLTGVGPVPALWSLPGGHLFYEGGTPASRSGVQTEPRFPLTSSVTGALNHTPAFADGDQGEAWKAFRYPRSFGGLHLGMRPIPDAEGLRSTYLCAHQEDQKAEPWNAYVNDSCESNFFDPFVEDPSLYPDRRNLAVESQIKPSAGNQLAYAPPTYAGFVGGPLHARDCGLQLDWKVDRSDPLLCANRSPLPRGEYDGNATIPDLHTALEPKGEIASGVMEYWMPWYPGNRSTEGTILWYHEKPDILNTGVPQWNPMLTVISRVEWVDPATMGKFKVKIGLSEFTSVQAPLPINHVAIFFSNQGLELQDKTRVSVYVNGQICPSPGGGGDIIELFKASQAPHWSELCPSEIGTRICSYNVRRLSFYDGPQETPAASLARFQAGFFVNQGTYGSQPFRFDAVALPRGARLSGFAWDGYIPRDIGGRIVFRMDATDLNGGQTLLDIADVATESDKKYVPLASRPVGRDVKLRIDMSKASGWPDSPYVTECVFYYGDTPRISGYGIR